MSTIQADLEITDDVVLPREEYAQLVTHQAYLDVILATADKDNYVNNQVIEAVQTLVAAGIVSEAVATTPATDFDEV